jgi:site-specific DNA-cytosine methylase
MGFPIGYTEVLDAKEKDRSRKALPVLQSIVGTESDQREAGRQDGVPEEKVLRSAMHGDRDDQANGDKERIPEEGAYSSEASMRDLRRVVASDNPPQGSKLVEQRTIESSDAMFLLPHLLASCERRDRAASEKLAMQILQSPNYEQICLSYLSESDKAGWRSSSREYQAEILCEAGTATRALMDRTKRLRALGNAVVPQVAQWLGERIMNACREMP